jgi:hypothetical protein
MDTATDRDSAVRLCILTSFLDGTTPNVASVARDLRADTAGVAESFDRLAAGRAIVLRQGSHDIRMAAPFSGVPTDFVVRIGERSYFANCIWDALGIPAMLAAAGRATDAEVDTRCADCGELLRLQLVDRDVRAHPRGAVAHFAVPAAKWWADIVFT